MTIIDRYNDATAAIARAATDCGRDPASVTLVCVTKTFPAEDVVPLLDAGHHVFGENRVQEAMGKWPGLREKFPGVELHLIGPLQSNKAKEAVETFDVIESVDREKIAAALADEMRKQGKRPRLFVQVNTGAEPQKAGILPGDADSFLMACRDAYKLEISGLMCVPPVDQQASPHFALLADIAARNGLRELSMGMSSDFELAIQLGATYVRVGSAIMGHRDYKQP
ncbi:YggS family pyridoxal phosphate-dependent enzyme [Methylocystis parvus]|uniref:Pyridoxal phosphate homeostasis protein n=1 Tax=Methylocystis parvus TaxID=134 RepID=A0A6B8M391_9HYPH|nr:YggS family pyridoxal phosphate-dependent enzyme [Methylocystis parvus]QGM98324.1 YggS family pyridoxal phosphate-dependent enzyme [Methylocystis parvus]WBK01348.1 YggS family pyridoxal phosphate-dependent enzyme [Methylocystis parvus OBBP]